jgi:hypothetical protein
VEKGATRGKKGAEKVVLRFGAQEQGLRIKITSVCGADSRVEHVTRVLFPATRRKHLEALVQTRRTSKFVWLQILAPFPDTRASHVCGQWPQTAPESGAPPGRRSPVRNGSSLKKITRVRYAAGDDPGNLIREPCVQERANLDRRWHPAADRFCELKLGTALRASCQRSAHSKYVSSWL